MGAPGYEGKHVVVTGGTGALGAAVVARLLDAGAPQPLPPRPGHPAGAPWAGHGRVRLVPLEDLADEAAVERAYAALPPLWASIHVAGGWDGAALEATSKAALERMLATNVVTAFLCCREAAKRIRAGGGGGRIVNVSSKVALEPRTGAGQSAYAAAKSAVAGLTLALGEELAPDGIWVNAVVPSVMDTPANRAAMPKADASRWPKVEEVAATIAFLASPENRVTRSALVPVYGRS